MNMKNCYFLICQFLILLACNNAFGQTSEKYLLVFNQSDNAGIINGENTVLFVSQANNQLNIYGGAAVGLFPKGENKIALSLDNSILGEIKISVNDITGKEFSFLLDVTNLSHQTFPLELSSTLSLLSIKTDNKQATFNLQEYINIAK